MRIIDLNEYRRIVKALDTDGDRVALIAGRGSEPVLLVDEFVRLIRNEWEIWHCYSFRQAPYLNKDNVRVRALFEDRWARAAKNVVYTPVHYSDVPNLIARVRPALFLTSMRGSVLGYWSWGPVVDFQPAAVRYSKVSVALWNSQLPYTYGEHEGSLREEDFNQITFGCFHDASPLTLPGNVQQGEDEVVRAIACNVAEVVPKGGIALQVGVGGLGKAILEALAEDRARRVQIHTEAFFLPMLRLRWLGPARASFLWGGSDLYKLAHENPQIQLLPVDEINSPRAIENASPLWSINGALQVDLTGAVNADWLGGQHYSGVGGHGDFARGAHLYGGGSVIVLPSTAQRGKVSRICPAVERTTTPSTDVDYVVTEWGAAHLTDKNLKERAEALIQVAHPRVREKLRASMEGRLWG